MSAFKNAEALEPLFEAGCRKVEIHRYHRYGSPHDDFWYQCFTDKNPNQCHPMDSVEEAVGEALKQIKETIAL